MFIDEKGKIFGKINVIDLALIVLIIAAGAFVGVKFFGNSSADTQTLECSYVVKIENIKETSLKYLKTGDTLYNDDNAFMGVIEKEPEYVNATEIAIKNDGSYAEAELPERVDVLLTIRGEGMKNSNGFYLDGKVSAIFGTHTHVQTNDAAILQNGTAYITDLGMSGPVQSVLGVRPDIIIERFKNGEKGRFVLAEGENTIEGILFEVDPKTSKAEWIKTVKF